MQDLEGGAAGRVQTGHWRRKTADLGYFSRLLNEHSIMCSLMDKRALAVPIRFSQLGERAWPSLASRKSNRVLF